MCIYIYISLSLYIYIYIYPSLSLRHVASCFMLPTAWELPLDCGAPRTWARCRPWRPPSPRPEGRASGAATAAMPRR